MKNVQLTKDAHNSYKIGIDEIVGLSSAMREVFKPIQSALKEKMYWSDVEVLPTEYKSRDGFIPYSHNCGGIEISEIIPECESYDFQFLEFGEWDGTHYCDGKDTENCDCPFSQDGEYDALLRILFKFEGIDEETKKLKFYLNVCGGNNDAPYYRLKYLPDIFEAEFTASSVAGIKRAASKHVQKILKLIEGK
jgi:hypothetical protein